MSLQEELTETTVEDKLRRLVTFFTEKCFDEIDTGFDLTNDINTDREYFLEMMAGALTYHFGIESDADCLRDLAFLGDLVEYVSSRL